MALDIDKLNAILDAMTDEEIAASLVKGVWGPKGAPRERTVQAHLDRRLREKELEIARSTSDAAWAAVEEAEGANRRATIALVIAALALLIAILSAFLG